MFHCVFLPSFSKAPNILGFLGGPGRAKSTPTPPGLNLSTCSPYLEAQLTIATEVRCMRLGGFLAWGRGVEWLTKL